LSLFYPKMYLVRTLLVLSLVTQVFGFAPLLGSENPSRIEGQYIVIFHPNATESQIASHISKVANVSKVLHTYDMGPLFRGFAAALSDRDLQMVRAAPFVDVVHYDAIETIDQSCIVQDIVPSWGIERVSTEGPPTELPGEYHFGNQAGFGVVAFIIDTGIYIDHADFELRAVYGVNYADGVATDENGHGTHVAGTVGGLRYGIAKKVELVAVKVLGRTGSGSTSNVVAGINWVTNEKRQKETMNAVANMSLGGTSDGGKCAAIAASVAAGVTFAVSAGNDGGNACTKYPASCPSVISVGSTALSSIGNDQIDERSSFSNYGTCVSLFGPGSAITSCGITSRTSESVKSGTSMSSPHTCGVAALILAENPTFSPAQIKQALIDTAQDGLINNAGPNSPNKLLFKYC